MIGDIVISSTWPGQQCHEITQRDVSVSCNHLAHTNKQTAQQQTICLQANKTSHTSASSQMTQSQGVYSAATPVRVDVNLQSAHCYDAGSVQCWMHLACWVSHIIRVSHWAFQQSLPCMWCCFPRSSTWANSPPFGFTCSDRNIKFAIASAVYMMNQDMIGSVWWSCFPWSTVEIYEPQIQLLVWLF